RLYYPRLTRRQTQRGSRSQRISGPFGSRWRAAHQRPNAGDPRKEPETEPKTQAGHLGGAAMFPLRVITLIHRQETMSLLGFPVVRSIDIEDSELVLQGIRLTPPEMPTDLIMHTP